jgi:hypothetical protein
MRKTTQIALKRPLEDNIGSVDIVWSNRIGSWHPERGFF